MALARYYFTPLRVWHVGWRARKTRGHTVGLLYQPNRTRIELVATMRRSNYVALSLSLCNA
eukprot:1070095-Amphidinium_carterae.1